MLKASNKDELATALSTFDIAVPMRSEGRTTEHVERYAFVKLLSTLNFQERLYFPLSVTKEERPDFVLKAGVKEIGIEHTEAVSQNEAHKSVLRERYGKSGMHFISHASPLDVPRAAKALKVEIENDDPGEGWIGDSVETEWAEAMLHFAKLKQVKLLKPGFRRFQEDWLLIYDNWLLPALKRKKGSKYLYNKLMDAGIFVEFSSIFVLSGNKVCEFSQQGFQVYNVVDLCMES